MPIEFAFKPYRAPVPYLVLLMVLPLVGLVIAGLLLPHAPAPSWAFAGGGAVAVVLAMYIFYKDNRLQPAGVLRLMAGRLVYTADAVGPLHLQAEDVRDMVVGEDRLIVRQKYGRSLVVHVARIEVPLAEVQSALQTWVDNAGRNVGERFAEASKQAEHFEARRQQLARVAGTLQRATGRLGWLLKLFGK